MFYFLRVKRSFEESASCASIRRRRVAVLLLAGWAATASGQSVQLAADAPMSVGYVERSCSFDLDDDGIYGEPADDCRICDGKTPDPDGDGVLEDLIYVDCDQGSDSATCGSVNQPCRTLEHAFGVRSDGPADGAEDIVCFRGTCSPDELTPGTRGVPGDKERAPKGNETRAFRYPKNPAMLVGWDSDGDGSYPPADKDDVAVLDGARGARARAFVLNDGVDNSYFEMAHFTARDYNRYSPDPAGGFLKPNRGRDTSHLYVHDLELLNISQDQEGVSGNITFELFGSQGLRYFAVENIKGRNIGGYFVRGSGGDGPQKTGPFRFEGLDLTAHGCDEPCNKQATFTGFKVWGHLDGLEILDSVFDCNASAWKPQQEGAAGCSGVAIAQCVQDVDIINNRMIDQKNPLLVQGASSGFCDGAAARPVDDVVIERNWVHNSFAWDKALEMVSIRSGSGADTKNESVGSVTVRNNSFSTRNAGYDGCLSYTGGNDGEPNPGTIQFLNNSCWGRSANSSVSAVILHKRSEFVHQDFVIQNNLFQGLSSSDRNVDLRFEPEKLLINSNSYDPSAGFGWLGSSVDFSSWKSRSGGDKGSSRCRVSFEDPINGDLRLRFSDTCAQDRGNTLDAHGLDLDGEARRAPWDRGADEVSIGDRPSLSLADGRYRVAAQFDTGKVTGDAQPRFLTDDSAFFTFLNANNVEAVLKVLNGCPVNGRVWVFGTGLTNLETAIRIEDRDTGEVWTHLNPSGQAFGPVQDLSAFAGCP